MIGERLNSENLNPFFIFFFSLFQSHFQMRRLTVDVIMKAPAFRNTLHERELDLRGNKIPRIENLGATQDQFDVIDLSNNQIEILEDFPRLSRCGTLLVHNNLVSRIGSNFSETLPNIHTLMLTNNSVRTFEDIRPLQRCTNLIRLSLMLNPIAALPNYRLIIIHLLPSVRFLDFQRISNAEREEAAKLVNI
ncbi:hypothetical protein TRFO_28243 [Tritrichomonas foetus]|uniref:Uncharacterized protein n=1 Tax=Tritrichomonas foetus TaxID=1144522 RepID=A0A1J4K0I8_9EUKA|nr:hypothetical protein TRFO_28243 [Tritrichomonas foetus]|eukprot:OHT04264.1 hypothetical protein TRFO_28243 [Tritrichomonas foetus]